MCIGVQLITELASQVDEVMPRVVEAALAVKRSPGDATAKSRLDAARVEWAQKVQQLTAAIDDIIDPEDFMAVSGRLHVYPPVYRQCMYIHVCIHMYMY